MNFDLTWRRAAQGFVVLAGAFSLKQCYSTAGANQLRWILAPTTLLVELVSGVSFEFESHAGYISDDRTFLIATSCAGVNFLITAFLMLSARRLLAARSGEIPWMFVPATGLMAYLATLVANTVRISVAMELHRTQAKVGSLTSEQLHRFEGIVVYFGFLLLLWLAAEAADRRERPGLLGVLWIPMAAYYAVMLGIPLANGGYRRGPGFWEHSLFVVLVPLLLILPLAGCRLYRRRLQSVRLAGAFCLRSNPMPVRSAANARVAPPK
jgi:exosortase K